MTTGPTIGPVDLPPGLATKNRPLSLRRKRSTRCAERMSMRRCIYKSSGPSCFVAPGFGQFDFFNPFLKSSARPKLSAREIEPIIPNYSVEIPYVISSFVRL